MPQDTSMIDTIEAPSSLLEFGLFSSARIVDNTIYLAGHTALDGEGKVLFAGDPVAQYRYSLESLRTTLEAAGSSLAQLVQMTLYVTDIRYRSALHSVRGEYLVRPPYPASTLVEVSGFAFEGLTVEIDGIAYK
jgi:2-iminobutanoate/2-iminopropanoate deaminase